MIIKAFNIVCDKVYAALENQGFKKNKVDNTDASEMVALFTGENVAYSVIYYVDKMHMVMRSCAMTDEGPDNEWKTMATWMFNPETDTEREANSIGNDFADAVSTPVNIKRVKQTKKKKSDESGADPVFLAKRLVKLFPQLKAEIKNEEDSYYPFRSVTFTREFIVPKVNTLVAQGSKAEITKLMSILSAQYLNGDPDTRAIITIVILNSIDEKHKEVIESLMSTDLLKAYKSALKFKGKKVKPEKVKKVVTQTGTRL
ncbi:MAG: hypothetical protein E7513_05780 [Ruminococcaceae bacterium]|nr:hypothetical protein [Oscillospiraceae bacterium]